jgi:DNA polymerase I-like protein with 3'-5' exonuclease and polymerase domains/5'-3' exonuclease
MTRLAVDMSSYLKTALNAGKDEKDGQLVVFEDKQVLVNSAEYGYENFTNMMVKTLRETRLSPKNVLLVFEGLQSKSKRLIWDSGYKGKRDKKPPEFYEQFQRLREFVESQWLGLGAIALCQDYAEADDTLAFLAHNIEEDLVIASRDGDLGVFNFVNEHGANVQTFNDGLLGIVKLDGELFVHPAKYVTLYKALVGDSSDSIAGCKGFGPAKFQKLAEQYGYDGLDELMGMLDAGSLGPVHGIAEESEHKLLKLLVQQEADVVRCWKLVKMYPEWINTMKHPLRIQGGKISSLPKDVDERLKDFYSQEWLVTADNYAESLEFFKANMVGSEVTFDIESSTPDESDEWLASRPKPKNGKGGDKVDQLGSILSGFSFTFGANDEFTFYLSVDHAQTNNVPMSKAREVIEAAVDAGKKIVIHNNFFELCVLAMAKDEDGTKWLDHWNVKYPDYHGFLPGSLDTKMEASYVNENVSNGLKFRSKLHLGYEQQSYEATTTLSFTHWEGEKTNVLPGGKLVSMVEGIETRQYKMRELPAEHVVAYGCDDTICTAALHNLFNFIMQVEHTYKVYLDVEIDASYQHAKNFIDGMPFSLEKMRELEKHDDATFERAWATLREYLIKKGWEGTVPPTYGADITAKQIKQAYEIVVLGAGADGAPEIELAGGDDGDEEEGDVAAVEADEEDEDSKDPFLATRVRTPAKLAVLARELGHTVFAEMLERCLAGQNEAFTNWVRERFSGQPLFKGSNKQMQHLLYEVMGLPVRVRNKPTKVMYAKGIKEGNPKGDVLAMEYALRDGDEEQQAVIKAIKLMNMVKTRRQLYYSKYPWARHWITGRIHGSHNQCQTNTRRASESDVNKQQLPKDTKITGEPARFRETIVPHHKDAVIVSLDFDSQELRIIADHSKDANMVACFVGANKKSMHSLTGHSILTKRKKLPYDAFDYNAFNIAAKKDDDPNHELCVEYRKLGKKVNFTTEFGAMAPKLAATMLCTEEEAQVFIDAKESMFPGVRKWKDETIAEAKRLGFVKTKLGAIRHLRDAFLSDDHWVRSKAERQSVNFKVQSTAAEMTKKAEARMWRMGLVYKYDCICIGPIHDEVVFSVAIKDLEAFLVDAHWCMTQPYGDMEIPIESSISFGPSFGEQFEIGTKPTAEAVAEGWRQINDAKAKAAAAIRKAKEKDHAEVVA